MGGRGAKSTYGKKGITTGDSGRPLTFYDKTDLFKGMTVQEFENAVRDRKVEYIGLYNDDGKIMIAGTSYNKGGVAIPTEHPDFNKINSFTHNHPYQGGREIGGSFSGADARAGTFFGAKTIRATSKEKTYVLRPKNPSASQKATMYNRATKVDSKWREEASKRVARVKKQFEKSGKKWTSAMENKVYLGYGTRLWKNLTRNSGYEYVEIKQKNR